MLPAALRQEPAPRLLWPADDHGQRAERIQCARQPPVVEVRCAQTRVYMFGRRGDANQMTRPHIEFRQEIIQEHEITVEQMLPRRCMLDGLEVLDEKTF